MTKKTLIYLMSFLLMAASCSRVEDSLFDESAAVRLNKSVNEITDILMAADNGWIMEYFPNEDSPGVVYVVDFISGKEATMATINPYVANYKEANGYWRIISDMGPVLTFDTYNEIFHIYADPVDPSSGKSDGVGLGGDYEFLIVSATEEEVQIKGKKNGVLSLLRKMEKDVDWEDYLTAVKDKSQTIFGTNFTPLELIVDDKLILSLKNGGEAHVFTATPAGGNEIDDAYELPFMVTDYGICLTTPFMLNEKAIRNFALSEDGNSLLCTDKDVDADIRAAAPEQLFLYILNQKKYMTFTYDDALMSASVQAAYDLIDDKVRAATRKIDYIAFVNEKNLGFTLAMATSKGTSKAEGNFGYDYAMKGSSHLQLERNEKINSNAKNYLNNFDATSFVDLINGEYALTAEGPALSSTTIKFVDLNDAEKWFILTLK